MQICVCRQVYGLLLMMTIGSIIVCKHVDVDKYTEFLSLSPSR